MQVKCTDVIDWVRPKYVFDYYTSTTLVTTKRSMPMWMRWLVVATVVVIALVFAIKWQLQKKIEDYSAVPAAQQPMGAGLPVTAASEAGAGAGGPVTYASTAEYAKAHLPRIGTMPWTAPIYDQRAITTDPQLICMSSMEGLDGHGKRAEASCTCLTEQGTRYELSQPECRTLARNGPVYNPYKTQRDFSAVPKPPEYVAEPLPLPSTGITGTTVPSPLRPMGTFPESPQNRYDGG